MATREPTVFRRVQMINGETYNVCRLVPVEVFGAEDGYGLSDATSAWSDCNGARGHLFRFETLPIDVAIANDEREFVEVVVLAGDPAKHYGDVDDDL